MATAYHARYFAHELTRRRPADSADRLSMSLFDAAVDLNPHQIDAALFALRSPLSKGVLLADEVGLGKTIEAGLVLCQLWAERRRRLLVICPASIRKQWALELEEKFNLPTFILDRAAYREAVRRGNPTPFEANAIVIVSLNFASAMQEEVRASPWDLVVIDEAHKLRNAYRPSNRMGQRLRWALEDRRKLLLTATPLQNTLLELYGLSTLIDDHIFGDRASFQAQFGGPNGDQAELRRRLAGFTKRTLRNQVLEYVRYTQRRALTQPFRPADDEQHLYEAVSDFLAREGTFSIPERQRTLTTLVLRKLLASSSIAIAGTLETMRARLLDLRASLEASADAGAPIEDGEGLLRELIEADELEDEYLDEPREVVLAAVAEAEADPYVDGTEESAAVEAAQDLLASAAVAVEAPPSEAAAVIIDRKRLDAEVTELEGYIAQARGIAVDEKSRALLTALETGFAEMDRTGAARKAVIFTESRRTQEYLAAFLDRSGYAGRTVTFSGTNTGPAATAIYEHWLAENRESGRSTGSRDIDVRTALIEHFRDRADIMIATEAAAEGINLQFCSLVVNYDLPWNPQRIEQRIGRCHRYGQEHDVVVLNFLNERNEADRRVLELLSEKFRLFDGVFGASDEVLGTIESGVDFERRVLEIYQQCRTPEEIEAGFRLLQEAMDDSIRARLHETRQALFDHFDEDVHARLRLQLEGAREQLDRVGQMFWGLTTYVLRDRARFEDGATTFDLLDPPGETIHRGRYHLISKQNANVAGEFLYRLSHPLGEWAIDAGRALPTPDATVTFDITHHGSRIADVERLRGHAGWLTLRRLTIDAFDTEEHLLFSGLDEDGASLDQETCEKLFRCDGLVAGAAGEARPTRLAADADRHVAATLARASEASQQLFHEERDRLDRWAEDVESGAQKALDDVKAQIRAVTREARLAATVEAELALQKRRRDLEQQQRRQRQRIFEVEDEIREQRDSLIDQLEQRMRQRSAVEDLFTIRWRVV